MKDQAFQKLESGITIVQVKFAQLLKIEWEWRENYNIETCALASEYDMEIANICFQYAKEFIYKNESKYSDIDIKAQVLTLKYLLFRFMNNNSRGYISTKELICHSELVSESHL